MDLRLVGLAAALTALCGGLGCQAASGPLGEGIPWSGIRLSLELAQQDKDGFPHVFRVTFENASGRRAVLSLPGPLPGSPEGPEWLEGGFMGFGFKSEDGRESEIFAHMDMRATKPPHPEQVVLAPGERVQRVYRTSGIYLWRPEGPVEAGRLSDHLGPGGQQLQAVAALVYVAEEDRSERPSLKSVVSEPVVIRCSFDDYVIPETEPEGPTTPLHRAVRQGDVKAVERLLAEGADVNARDKYENTPLHLAAGEGNVRIAEMLLAKGASLAAVSSSGDTPLHRAARAGNVEAMKLLIAKGAEVDARTPVTELTPLHSAALAGQIESAEVLLVAGADPNARSEAGDMPIHLASLKGHERLVTLFLDRSVYVNAKGDNDLTPLHRAAGEGYKGFAELLLARGADPNARDRNGWTPLTLAAMDGHEGTSDVLLGHGADPNVKDKDGKTPLAFAREGGHKGVVTLLEQHGAKE